MEIFAAGLENPRGLKFGPDGYLYVAEGGRGGSHSTEGNCTQVPPPIGPYTGGMTARISKISPAGDRTTVAEGLPSSQTSPGSRGAISGVADVAFIGGQLYALLAGAGCSHGVPEVPNGVIRVDPDGNWEMIADLGAFLQANPVKNPDPEDDELDGTWYSLISVEDVLFAVEPNHGEIDQITPDGDISLLIDISASQGHIMPTSIDFYQDSFYVGNLSPFPLVQGAAKILQISRDGKDIRIYLDGLTNVLGCIFDKQGRLYVLESTTGHPRPTRDSGVVVRAEGDSRIETIVTGLSLPTAMTFGPDGALYVSNKGFGFPPDAGEILRIPLED